MIKNDLSTKNYRANAVAFKLWFPEFKKTISLLSDGLSIDEIKEKNKKENIFNARSTSNQTKIMNSIINRVCNLDSSFNKLFLESDLETQKFLSLVAYILTDRLFFEYIYEVLKDKYLLGLNTFETKDFLNFIDKKREQNEKALNWKKETLISLSSTYRMMLIDSGLAKRENKDKCILVKPLISPEAIKWIEENNLTPILNALSGVNE